MTGTNDTIYVNVYPRIEEEISRVASQAYSQDGVPLYDNIVLKSRDRGTIDAYIEDALNTIVAQTEHLSRRTPEGDIEVSNPDMDPSQEEYAVQELARFVVLNTVSAWLQDRFADRAPEYAARGQAALTKAITILHQRTTPTREI